MNGGGLLQIWQQGDGVTRTVALLLLVMSVCAWVLIFWKAWLLGRVRRDIARALPAFWAASDLDAGRVQLGAFDRASVLLPLLDAATGDAPMTSLGAHGELASQLTRRLRDSLHAVIAQLQYGQIALASIGSTAPFVGLFGTVWGIHHALGAFSSAGTVSIDRVAGPVGEALVMTAAGLAVAIPAVLGFNIFGRRVSACEAELEGFAHDLREMRLDAAQPRG